MTDLRWCSHCDSACTSPREVGAYQFCSAPDCQSAADREQAFEDAWNGDCDPWAYDAAQCQADDDPWGLDDVPTATRYDLAPDQDELEASAPLDSELNLAILHMAWRLFPNGFDVADNAPSSFPELVAHMDSGRRMCVWSGASDQTIFGDARVNYAFRAWHDWHHYHGKLPFTPTGEALACERQCADLVRVFGNSPTVQRWCDIIVAEVIGQLDYSKWHDGDFPTDQMAFVRAYLADDSVVVDVF